VPAWGAALLVCALAAPSMCSGAHGAVEVVATAYTSHAGQTSGDPTLAAWGDRLGPDTRAVAVSRDLLRMGLERGDVVRIEGLPGEYRVLDKMAARWRRRIDVYMGRDLEAARAFGRREVTLRWGHDRGGGAR
jgi:3D (Asp-Asp-Asp) domain-containing protein